MKKKVLQTFCRILVVVLLGAAVLFPIFARASVSDAVEYLKSEPQDPWITQALVAAGESEVETGHLESVSGVLATDYAKVILALAAVGENPATFGNIDYVAQLKTYYQNNQMGSEDWLNDDMWSILSLSSVGEENSVEALGAKDFLLSNQNLDGGWSWAVGGDSDTNDTSAAIMALLEVGVDKNSLVITKAVDYLLAAQNDDGGFPWLPGSNSDSGSDSWVISALYELGQDPLAWDKNGNNPITHLNSLQDSDGGFWWVAPGTSDFNNKAMTAFAVIALSGKGYPVDYYRGESEPDGYHLRIEGKNNTICDAYIEGNTAMDVVVNGSEICGYTYVIVDTTFGPYLKKINDEEAGGMSGWMYFVNAVSPMVGAADYVLSENDDVLWYYGDWGWKPTRLTLDSNSVGTGENVLATVKYFDGENWQALADAAIKGTCDEYITNDIGEVTLSLPDGYYTLYVEKESYVRSNSESLMVGDGSVSQSVDLRVEIKQGQVAGELIIFEINPSQIDFGEMEPGQENSDFVVLSNKGTVNLNVLGKVEGDQLFKDNIEIDDKTWTDYSQTLDSGKNQSAQVDLSVPIGYLGSGIKTGELIFWAYPQ